MNRSVLDSLNNASLTALAQLKNNSLCTLFMSLISIITNFLVIYVICRTKNLHNKSQYLIAFYSIAELVSAFIASLNSFAKYIGYVYGIPFTCNQLTCKFLYFPSEFWGIIGRRYLLLLALDRFICVCKPVFYKLQSNKKYLLVLHLLTFWTFFVRVPLYFTGYDVNKWIPVCLPAYIQTSVYANYQAVETNVQLGLTISVYILAPSAMLYRYKTTKFAGEFQKREWKKSVEFDAFSAIVTVGIIYFVTSALSSILYQIQLQIGSVEANAAFGFSTVILYFIGGASHLFVYLKMNGLFRQAFVRLVLKRDSNAVLPM